MKQKKIFILFFLVMFLIGTDTFLISPLLPTLTKTYQISTSISGWMVSAYALGYALFALLAGPISDGLNRKKVMVFGLLAFSVSTFICGLAPSFEVMILCRLLAGISASFVTPQVWASIPLLVEPKEIVKAMGYASAGLSISQLVGIPIGSYLASFTWHIPFFTLGGCSLLLMIIIFFTLPDINTQSTSTAKVSITKTYGTLLQTPRAVKYFFAYFVFQTGTFATFTFLGSWFAKDFHLLVNGVGTAMIAVGLGNTIGSLFGSHITKKLGEPKSLLISLIILVPSYFVLPFASTITFAEVILFLIYLVNGCLFPVLMTIMQSISATARGTVSAIANAVMYGGKTLGGILGGLLFTNFSGFYGVSFFTGVVYALALLIYATSGIFKDRYAHDTIQADQINS